MKPFPPVKERLSRFVDSPTNRNQFRLLSRETDDANYITDAAFEKDAQKAACLRWLLRGLPLDKAIRKVETDSEIATNNIKAQRDRRATWAERREQWKDRTGKSEPAFYHRIAELRKAGRLPGTDSMGKAG